MAKKDEEINNTSDAKDEVIAQLTERLEALEKKGEKPKADTRKTCYVRKFKGEVIIGIKEAVLGMQELNGIKREAYFVPLITKKGEFQVLLKNFDRETTRVLSYIEKEYAKPYERVVARSNRTIEDVKYETDAMSQRMRDFSTFDDGFQKSIVRGTEYEYDISVEGETYRLSSKVINI
jgi:hypothetical protein